MSMSRKRVISLLLAMMLLVAVPSASAGAATTPDRIVREPVTWTLTPAQCPDIHRSITGTGQRIEVITTTVKADGTTVVITNDFVNGPAVDTGGGIYYFIYANQTTELRPPRGGPIQVHMTDTFVLTGNAGVNSLNVDFVWNWTYTPPAPQWPPVDNWQRVYNHGQPLHCDPI